MKSCNITGKLQNKEQGIFMSGTKTACITGISGMDAAYLSKHLLSLGYKVVGTRRRTSTDNLWRLRVLGILEHENLEIVEADITDLGSLIKVFREHKPHEVYNLAAMSHVGTSFSQPKLTWDVTAQGAMNVVDAAILCDPGARIYHACHDSETKAVTPYGIKEYSELSIGDSVYTINEITKEIEIKKIRKIHEFDHLGDMIRIKSKRIDQLVTPNHRVLFQKDGEDQVRGILAEDLFANKISRSENNSDTSLPFGRILGGKDEDIILSEPKENICWHKNLLKTMPAEDFMYLFGVFIGDGHIKNVWKKKTISRKEREKQKDEFGRYTSYTKKSKETIKEQSNFISLAVPEEDPCRAKVISILSRNNIEYKTYGIDINFSCYGLKEVFKTAGKNVYYKHIPVWVRSYNKNCLQRLFEGLIDSDGHIRKENGSMSFYTTSHRLAANFVDLCFMLGYYPNMSTRLPPENKPKIDGREINGRESYIISVGQSGTNKVYNKHIGLESYNGKVWCLEVEGNSNFLVCRNGKICFSGNSTSEMFGSNYEFIDGTKTQTINTKMDGNSPYGCAKFAAHNYIRVLRESGDNYVCSGILYNHGSPLRGENFFERKVTKYVGEFINFADQNVCNAENITFHSEHIECNGKSFAKLRLGNLDPSRDMGHSSDYVRAMHLMLQRDEPKDYIICSGETHQMKDIVKVAFEYVGLDWEKFVFIDPKFFRPREVEYLRGDCSSAKKELNWELTYSLEDMIHEMVDHDIVWAKEDRNYG